MTTRADNYSLHYRITRIERKLGIVNKWTSLPEGADIYEEAPYFPDANGVRDTLTDEPKQPGPNYVPLGGAGNGG